MKILGTKIIFVPKIHIWTNIFWEQNSFLTKNFLNSKNFQTQIFFDPKRSSLAFWYKPTKLKSFEPKTFQAEDFRPKSCF